MLALPYTFSYLTWSGGVIALVLSASVSLYTSYLLAALHQDESGVRHNRYLDLGRAVLGAAPFFVLTVFWVWDAWLAQLIIGRSIPPLAEFWLWRDACHIVNHYKERAPSLYRIFSTPFAYLLSQCLKGKEPLQFC